MLLEKKYLEHHPVCEVCEFFIWVVRAYRMPAVRCEGGSVNDHNE